jgi:hypothetical protein
VLDVNWLVRRADLQLLVRVTKVNRIAKAIHKAENALLFLKSNSTGAAATVISSYIRSKRERIALPGHTIWHWQLARRRRSDVIFLFAASFVPETIRQAGAAVRCVYKKNIHHNRTIQYNRGSKNQRGAPVLLSSATHHIRPSNRIECRKRENRRIIVQIYHTYSSAESSILNVQFRLFVCFLYGI